MSKWYLAGMDYIVGCYKTKKEALRDVNAFHFRCHRHSYGYSIEREENGDWLDDSMWLFRDRKSLIEYGFEEQLVEYEKMLEEVDDCDGDEDC